MSAPMLRKGGRRFVNVLQQEIDRLRALPVQAIQCRYKKAGTTKKKPMPKTVKNEQKPETVTKMYVADAPTKSIYLMGDYPPQPFHLAECINMHQEAAHPNMTNTLHSQIYADFTLNLSTKKKTKFFKNVRGLLEFPHKFEHGQNKIFYAFSENEKHVEFAKEKGALFTGGEDIMNYIKQNLIRKEDIENCDFIFATPDMALKMRAMKSALGDKLPSEMNGCATDDMEEVIMRHLDNVRYRSYKNSESVGTMQIPFGQLSQDVNCLEENFKYMVEVCSVLKPIFNAPPYIESIRLIAPPSTEVFVLKPEEFPPKTNQPQKKRSAEEEDDDEEEA